MCVCVCVCVCVTERERENRQKSVGWIDLFYAPLILCCLPFHFPEEKESCCRRRREGSEKAERI